jgi:hypothetical protein
MMLNPTQLALISCRSRYIYVHVCSTDRQEAFVTIETEIRHLVYSTVEIGVAWFLISRRSIMYNSVEVFILQAKIFGDIRERAPIIFHYTW